MAKEHQRRELPNPGYLTIEAAAKAKGVSRGAVVKKIDQGEIAVMKVGKIWLVLEKDLAGWVIDESRRERGAQGGRPKNKKASKN